MLQDRIKKIRSYFGFSQANLAQKIDMSPGFISNLETGRCGISDKTITTLKDALGINPKWLTEESDNMLLNDGDSPVDKDKIGDRVRSIRKVLGLSQSELAKKIGYSSMRVSLVELGKAVPSNSFLHAIAVKLNINEQWLLTGKGNMMRTDNSEVDAGLIAWLNQHPKIVLELRKRKSLGE